jgi:hypothetical protein
MHPIAAIILVVLLAFVVSGSRRQALLAMMCGVLYISQNQQIQLFGVSLFPSRFLEVAGFIRVLSRREFTFVNLNRVDRALLWLYAFTTVVFLVRSKTGHGAAIATALDAGLSYFIFRGLIRNLQELRWLLSTLVVVLIPYMLVLFVERKTGRVPFPFMAGSAGMEGGFVRDGVPRCFGSFRNMALLGTLGVCLLPLYLGLIIANVDRKRALIGVGFCLAIVVLSNSGGPLSALGVAVVGWMLWPFRTQMRLFRWGLVAALALLALVMKAPVWYIIDRVSSITGGSGWHRSYLIDVSVRHLDKWWLMGIPIEDTRDWFPYTLNVTGGADITNQFLLFGITAGLGAIALLFFLLSRAFSDLGKALAVVRAAGPRQRATELMLWGLGVTLAAHAVNWLGITYYDQIYLVWFMQLAALATISNSILQLRTTGVVRIKPVIPVESTPVDAAEAAKPTVVAETDGKRTDPAIRA